MSVCVNSILAYIAHYHTFNPQMTGLYHFFFIFEYLSIKIPVKNEITVQGHKISKFAKNYPPHTITQA